jgi:hypothetical protein
MHTQEQYIQEAIQIVSAWPDVSDEDFAETVNLQAMIMSGSSPESWQITQEEYLSTSRQ